MSIQSSLLKSSDFSSVIATLQGVDANMFYGIGGDVDPAQTPDYAYRNSGFAQISKMAQEALSR